MCDVDTHLCHWALLYAQWSPDLYDPHTKHAVINGPQSYTNARPYTTHREKGSTSRVGDGNLIV